MSLLLSPVLLFVYNRPDHTEKVLRALMSNDFADKTNLFVFSDGPKNISNIQECKLINDTRTVVKKEKWCNEVVLIERSENLGLSKSIITGVTDIINKYETVIVLEDDILCSRGFLRYMNSALDYYRKDNDVGCIHGWNYFMNWTSQSNDTFFLRGGDCWGWATWSRAWNLFEPDGNYLASKIVEKGLVYQFNRNGTHQFYQMLIDQTQKKNDSWAIRWHASLFLESKYCLQPVRPIVKNIGLDGSGVHSGTNLMLQETTDYIEIKSIPKIESKWFYREFRKLLINSQSDLTKWQKLKLYLKHLFRL